MDCKTAKPATTELTKESPCEYKIDSETGSMLLIDMLYEKGKINKATYNNIQKKYGKKKNKDSEVSDYEK